MGSEPQSGAEVLFTGATGNYSFSSSHSYARRAAGHPRLLARGSVVGRSLRHRGPAATAHLAWRALRFPNDRPDDGTRGYARLLGDGRVPDVIRLRTRRGQQAADAWWATGRHRDRFLAAVDALADTPVLADIIDARALRARMLRWNWGEVDGPPMVEFLAVERLLHTAGFLRWVAPQLAPRRQ